MKFGPSSARSRGYFLVGPLPPDGAEAHARPLRLAAKQGNFPSHFSFKNSINPPNYSDIHLDNVRKFFKRCINVLKESKI